ncbi:hypothetical protein MTP99_006504 [Tenebrio molitor]|jgi:hypothetical protein|nr:hypothetical protein MTP99_006504 [Tenebrio molitor]
MYWDRDGHRLLFECLGLARTTTQHCLVHVVLTVKLRHVLVLYVLQLFFGLRLPCNTKTKFASEDSTL